jgi:curved DNA-binding protein CbpA
MKLSEIEASKLLGLSINCNMDQLKTQFKKLAKKYHPDKGGDEYLFNVLSDAYRIMHKRIKRNIEERDFIQLKQDAKENIVFSRDNQVVADEGFIKKFNKLFDENRLEDPVMDRGYDEFMKMDEIEVKSNSQISKFRLPAPQSSSKSLNFTELGKCKEDDFSGKNDSSARLHYMDYREAHMTSKLVNTNEIKKRDTYKNLNDIEKKRKSQNFKVTPEEEYYYKKLDEIEKKEEQSRLDNLKRLDTLYEKHSETVKGLFLQ